MHTVSFAAVKGRHIQENVKSVVSFTCMSSILFEEKASQV